MDKITRYVHEVDFIYNVVRETRWKHTNINNFMWKIKSKLKLTKDA